MVMLKTREPTPLTVVLGMHKAECEESLYEFVRYMWSVVEPAVEMVEGEVMEALCEHLQAITEGRIYSRRLIINVPPGFSKSMITNVMWPAWEWGPKRRPHYRYVTFSYSASLTERDNERCMRVVSSDRYQLLWGSVVKLDKVGVTKIQTNHTGWKLATSLGGVGTGERGDRLILDDLNSVHEIESKVVRESTNRWLRETMPSRLNDVRKSAIVNIQQRVHEEDATGALIGVWDDYCHLMIPMFYDPDRHCATEIGWEDWRKADDELAWPERFPLHEVKKLERSLGPFAAAGQLQQYPVPRGGGIIQRDWWQEWGAKESPPVEFVLASLDTAVKEKEESDYYALTVWAVWRDADTGTPKVLLLNAWRERAPLHDICERVVQTCRKLRVDRLVIEDKANGWVAQQEIIKKSRGWKFGISMFDPRRYGDKTARLLSVQHLFAEGLIYAPTNTDEAGNTNWREWAQMVIDEVAGFPRAKHDDLTDSCSMGLRYLRDIGFALNKSEHSREEHDSALHRKKSGPLYPV